MSFLISPISFKTFQTISSPL